MFWFTTTIVKDLELIISIYILFLLPAITRFTVWYASIGKLLLSSMIDNWIKSIGTFRISPRLSWLNSFMIFQTILPTRIVIIIYINYLTYSYLHHPSKSLSMKNNKSLLVIIRNLKLLKDCYYIGNNKYNGLE